MLFSLCEPFFQFFCLWHSFIIVWERKVFLLTYIKWPAPLGGVRLECAPEILERLRLLSIDGLLALPRVGMSIGGFLTGSVEQGRVRVSDTIEIPCSHANGPAFILTGPETARASAMAFGESHRQVVGWYCSKPRGELALEAPMAALFREICPEAWQVGLMIRPSTVEPTRAAMCMRDGEQGYVLGQAMDLVEYVRPVHHSAGAEMVMAEILPPVAEPAAQPAAEVRLPPAPPQDSPGPPYREPAFARSRPLPEETERPTRLYVLLAMVVAALLAVLYVNRFSLIPRPPLVMSISDSAGQITVRWNPEALEGIDEGSMVLNDGGELQTVAMTSELLTSGWFRSPRKSGRVIAKLTAGEVTGLTTWSAPAPPAAPPDARAPRGK